MDETCDFCNEELGSTGYLLPVGTVECDGGTCVEVDLWCGNCDHDAEIDDEAMELLRQNLTETI